MQSKTSLFYYSNVFFASGTNVKRCWTIKTLKSERGEVCWKSWKLVISFFPLLYDKGWTIVIVAPFKRKLWQTSPTSEPGETICFTQSRIFFKISSWFASTFSNSHFFLDLLALFGWWTDAPYKGRVNTHLLIKSVFSSVRSSNSHPDLLVITSTTTTPLFQIHTGPQHWTFTFWATTAI